VSLSLLLPMCVCVSLIRLLSCFTLTQAHIEKVLFLLLNLSQNNFLSY
jgi:hypothetical protein